jgi:hypothetical protein
MPSHLGLADKTKVAVDTLVLFLVLGNTSSGSPLATAAPQNGETTRAEAEMEDGTARGVQACL